MYPSLIPSLVTAWKLDVTTGAPSQTHDEGDYNTEDTTTTQRTRVTEVLFAYRASLTL